MPTLSRYLAIRFLKVFCACMASMAGLFVFISFFAEVGRLMAYEPRMLDLFEFFALQLPDIISDVYPFAALLAVLISLGLLTRHREVLALRACGISTFQLAKPLLALTFVLTLGVLAWNENVVPLTTTQSRFINDVVIKKKPFHGRYNATAIWFQAQGGFYNIDYYDANNKAVYGLTLYEADPSFRLNRIIEVASALWRNDRWQITNGTVKNFGPEGEIVSRDLEPGEFVLPVKPNDLVARKRDASEFSFHELWERISLLKARGLATEAFEVDLHEKIARPFAGLLMVLLGLPLAVGGGRRSGMAYSIGIGLVVGFFYWVVTAAAISAGRSGGLPPIVAAWAANWLFAVLAGAFYLGRTAVPGSR